MNRNKFRVMIGIFIVLLGLAVLVTPSFIRYQNEKAKVIILENARVQSQSCTDITPQDLDEPKVPTSKIESTEYENSEVKQLFKVKDDAHSLNEDTLGIIRIDKIDLELPVLSNFTEDNLDIAPCVMEESGEIGEVGNLSIAGHRSYTYGRQFNRLDEVQVGDSIIVASNGFRYTYNISDVFTVKPEEVWVLDGNGEDSMITLITCTPIRVATHRLIVRGLLVSVDPIKD